MKDLIYHMEKLSKDLNRVSLTNQIALKQHNFAKVHECVNTLHAYMNKIRHCELILQHTFIRTKAKNKVKE